MNILKCAKTILMGATILCSADVLAYSSDDFELVPVEGGTTGADPFLMISLSVELTQQMEAYNDGPQILVNPDGSDGLVCAGRTRSVDGMSIGVCYSSEQTYLGYFDPGKCYDYHVGNPADAEQSVTGPNQGELVTETVTTNEGTNRRPRWVTTTTTRAYDPPYFYPVGRLGSSACSNKFSGNYMNWASMTALDEFRMAMTGGARLVDTAGSGAKTLLARTRRVGWKVVEKHISADGITVGTETYTTDPRDVTPFDISAVRVNYDNTDSLNNDDSKLTKITFRDTSNDANKLSYKEEDTFYVIVQVCVNDDDVGGVEANCVLYGDGANNWYKPEGLIQENADKMRFALSSYTASTKGNGIDGGVLRAFAKYVGATMPSADGVIVNPNREVNEYGQMVFDPDNKSGESYVYNSGIINYINTFGIHSGRYKGNDPVAELFYESLRYIKGFDANTAEYVTEATSPETDWDGFPVLTNWANNDPVVDACQVNYMLYVGDQFGHEDRSLPGSGDEPSNPDTAIDYPALQTHIFTKEQNSAPDPGRGMGWGTAALAYYAWTNDMRPDDAVDGFDGNQNVKTFIVDTQEYKPNPPTEEGNPLWLAAKWGGFDDYNNDRDPNNGVKHWKTGDLPGTPEWDKNADGTPDNYTLASQPANLVNGLKAAFEEVRQILGAGSAAGVVSNTVSGQGMVVQGLYYPTTEDGLGNRHLWGGMIHGLFVDEHDNLREDTDKNGMITNDDTVITYALDSATKEVYVYRFSTTDNGETVIPYNGEQASLIPIQSIDSIWNSREQLASLSNDSGQLEAQRPYSTAVTTESASRYIFTAKDVDGDGIVIPQPGVIGSDTTIDFVEGSFPEESTDTNLQNNFRLLGLSDAEKASAPNIVNFIRGANVEGYRSRMVDYDNDGVAENWILGDIISSSPIISGKPLPTERYDLLHGDDTYYDFYQKYRDRRLMVYAGANDGMLHAFNSGFFDFETSGYKTALEGSTATAHPLGAELWAYVPYNLLPHLKWLTNPEYRHVYYVDGEPQTFDVNIFPNDADHPNGWGTILVVGFRFGGGEYRLDSDGDGSDDRRLGGAYVVLDVTNPEVAPKLVAEISDPNMGHTVGRPTIIKRRVPPEETGLYSDIGQNQDSWYLVMGSGPYGSTATERSAALSNAVSSQKARVFLFDLQAKEFVTFGNAPTTNYLEVPDVYNGFTGDFVAADWNSDFVDDVVYFGTVTGQPSDPGGDFWRLDLSAVAANSANVFSRVVQDSSNSDDGEGASIDLPISSRAYTYFYRGKPWIAFGTGRFYSSEDVEVEKQNKYFGVKEYIDPLTGTYSWETHLDINPLGGTTMVDVTNVKTKNIFDANDPWLADIVDEAGASPVTLSTGEEISNYVELRSLLHNKEPGGWFYDFKGPQAKQIGATIGEGPVISFSEYWPTDVGNSCEPSGVSHMNQLYLGTGLPAPYFELNRPGSTVQDPTVQDRWMTGVEIVGKVKEPTKPPGGALTIQSSTGEILSPIPLDRLRYRKGTMSWREIPVTW